MVVREADITLCLTTAALPEDKGWPVGLAGCPSVTDQNPTSCLGLLGGALNPDHGGLLPEGSCSSLSYAHSTGSLASDSPPVLQQPPVLPPALAWSKLDIVWFCTRMAPNYLQHG